MAYLERQTYRFELIVADDGIVDQTAALVEELAVRRSHLNEGRGGVRLLKLDHRGKGFAVRAGALAAHGEYVLLCDADLATPIEEWEKLHRKFVEGYEVVIGSREGL